MTGRAGLFNLNKECVLIAVIKNILDALDMPGRLSFLPELMAGTAPEPSETGVDRFSQ